MATAVTRYPIQSRFLNVVLVLLFLTSFVSADPFPSSGDPDIDRTRADVRTSGTTADTYQKRALLLFVWLGSLQQQSADTHPFFDTDKAYYELERKTIQGGPAAKEEAIQNICKVVDEGFQVLEEIFRTLKEEGPIYEPFTADPAGAPRAGTCRPTGPCSRGTNTIPAIRVHPAPKRARSPGKSR